MQTQIHSIICKAVDNVGTFLSHPVDCSKGVDTQLFGEAGQLDSMALVSLIVAIEEGIESELKINVILASEKAMSAHRSPFSTIGTLSDYVTKLIAEEMRLAEKQYA